MACVMQNCSISDDRFLWSCQGPCGKKFHAACAGAQRNHETQIRSLMLPLCADCQEKIVEELEFRKLLQHQQFLHKDIKALMELNMKICHHIKSFNIDEAFSSLESLQIELRGQLTDIVSAQKSTTASINKLRNAAYDLPNENPPQPPTVLKCNIDNIVQPTLESMQRQLNLLRVDLNKINSAPPINREDMEEIKTLNSMLRTLESKQKDSPQGTSQNLADELNDVDLNMFTPSSEEDPNSGWRWIVGGKTLWKRYKPDWRDFDESSEYNGMRNSRNNNQNRNINNRFYNRGNHNYNNHNRNNNNNNRNNSSSNNNSNNNSNHNRNDNGHNNRNNRPSNSNNTNTNTNSNNSNHNRNNNRHNGNNNRNNRFANSNNNNRNNNRNNRSNNNYNSNRHNNNNTNDNNNNHTNNSNNNNINNNHNNNSNNSNRSNNVINSSSNNSNGNSSNQHGNNNRIINTVSNNNNANCSNVNNNNANNNNNQQNSSCMNCGSNNWSFHY